MLVQRVVLLLHSSRVIGSILRLGYCVEVLPHGFPPGSPRCRQMINSLANQASEHSNMQNKSASCWPTFRLESLGFCPCTARNMFPFKVTLTYILSTTYITALRWIIYFFLGFGSGSTYLRVPDPDLSSVQTN